MKFFIWNIEIKSVISESELNITKWHKNFFMNQYSNTSEYEHEKSKKELINEYNKPPISLDEYSAAKQPFNQESAGYCRFMGHWVKK